MIRPESLQSNQPLVWSTGTGNDVWDMFCACIAGDLSEVRRLTDKDPSLTRCQYAYRTPLYFAVRENQLQIAAFLLEHGANPLGQDLLTIARDRGYTEMEKVLEAACGRLHGVSSAGDAVAQAIRQRDLSQLQTLLDAEPALLHCADSAGNQPIHWAVMTRQPGMVDDLLACGADPHAKRPDGARPVQLTNGDYHFRGWRDVPDDWPVTPAQMMAHLRSKGVQVDICTASDLGDLERVRELLRQDPALANRVSEYVSYYPGSGAPLRNAAAAGHMEIVKLLLESGADPNLPEEGIAPHGHALYSAVADGHHEIARLLLEHGANPNAAVESSADALSRAIGNSDQPMIDLLCSYGAAREVHLLAYYGDVRTAAAVFAVNPALANDPEALMNAAGEGQEAFVRLLLRYYPDLPKRLSFPAWSVGAKTRDLNVLLFQHGMNPSQPDWLGITPLHHFARTGDVERAQVFIEHGADLNLRDDDLCSTPLGWAARAGKIEMVRLLLKHGAKPNLPDDESGFLWATPLAWATRRGYPDIAALLKESGARVLQGPWVL